MRCLLRASGVPVGFGHQPIDGGVREVGDRLGNASSALALDIGKKPGGVAFQGVPALSPTQALTEGPQELLQLRDRAGRNFAAIGIITLNTIACHRTEVSIVVMTTPFKEEER